jgi:hypothetical protein
VSQESSKRQSLLAPIDGRYKPSPADFERVQANLRAALAKGSQSRATSKSAVRLAQCVALSCVALVLVGAAMHSRNPAHASVELQSPTAAATTAKVAEEPRPGEVVVQAEQAPIPVVSIDALPQAPPASPSPLKAAAPAQPAVAKPSVDDDTLAREARLLSQAESAFRSGNDERSLALLDQHAKEFPDGQLKDERIAEHIVVLCHAGRVEQAKREGRTFLQNRASDPLARRIALSCAGASTTEAP